MENNALFETEYAEFGIISIGSVISESPMMRASESINIPSKNKRLTKTIKPCISKNKVGDRLKAIQKQILTSQSIPFDCVINRNKANKEQFNPKRLRRLLDICLVKKSFQNLRNKGTF